MQRESIPQSRCSQGVDKLLRRYLYVLWVFPMFDHQRAQRELGASVFVVRPAFLLGETVDDFMAHWQLTRDRSRRGIVEVLIEEAV
jgi:hypothetical protein